MAERTETTREWNATAYHRLSGPQVSWGRKVLARIPLRGDETVLDAGCGTGRLTAELLEGVPRGRVLAVDGSQNMIESAREHLEPRWGGRVRFIHSDLLDLSPDGLGEPVDLIVSTATFHWVRDHPRLFRTLYSLLKPGGLLVAQCGGKGNLDRLLERAREVMASPRFAPYFARWDGTWEYADAETTARRLREAGFVDVTTGIEPAPTTLSTSAEYREFLATIILRLHLERLPDASLRDAFLDRFTDEAASDDPPFSLDYQRLNLEGRRPV
jgi:trans-aconitate methyltransferase